MSTLGFILLFSFLGSLIALIGGFLLLINEKFAVKISHFLASFAAGVLLGTAFFDLLPEAAHEGEELGIDIFLWTLIGIIIFFVIERFIHWFHNHEEYHPHQSESKTTVPLVIIGDTMHNFIDGVVIALTFMVSIPLGIVTSIAVFLHEVPQEIGDFGILLHKGLDRKKIILINILSAGVAMLGAILAFLLGDILENSIPIFVSLTAGFFIYIATSDLIPEIHHEKRKGFALIETSLLILGVLTMWFSSTLINH
jgi:zinc and cadmium transporter